MTALAVGLLCALLACVVVQWIWNSLMADLFTVRRIRLWEAFKMLVFSLLLFGGATLSFHISETTTTSEGSKTISYGIGSGAK